MISASDRIATYWAISAVGFLLLFGIAAVRMWRQPSRPRLAIVMFAGSWAFLCAHNSFIRFHPNAQLMNDTFTEIVRLIACASLWGLIWEYVVGEITTAHHGWDGRTERRSGFERRRFWQPK